MKKPENRAHFNMSYAALYQLGDKAVKLIERDSTELAAFGIEEDYKNHIKEKTTELKNYPTDEEFQGLVSVSTEDKNKLADEIRVSISAIAVRIKNAFGIGSAEYKYFGFHKLYRLSDCDLHRRGKMVVSAANKYFDVLSERGFKEEDITELTNIVDAFDASIYNKYDAVTKRDVSTEERLVLSNELYKLISEVFDYGKNYWYTRKEAKYNDYIIYDITPSSPRPNIKVAAGTTISVSEEHAQAQIIFEIKNKGKAALTFFTANNANAAIPAKAQTLEPKETQILKAETISNGTYGKLIAVNTSDTDGKFTFAVIE